MHVCTYTHLYVHIYFTACGPPKHQRVMSVVLHEKGYTFSFLEHLVPHSHSILTSVHISVNLNHYYSLVGSTSYNVKLVRLENKQKWRKVWRLKECTMIVWVEPWRGVSL